MIETFQIRLRPAGLYRVRRHEAIAWVHPGRLRAERRGQLVGVVGRGQRGAHRGQGHDGHGLRGHQRSLRQVQVRRSIVYGTSDTMKLQLMILGEMTKKWLDFLKLWFCIVNFLYVAPLFVVG